MRILVTGAAGFIGRALLQRLLVVLVPVALVLEYRAMRKGGA